MSIVLTREENRQSASSCTDVQKLVNALATLQKSVEKIEAEMKSTKFKLSATKSDSAPQDYLTIQTGKRT